jgi:hypothetical protein
MEWEIYHFIQHAEALHNEEKDETFLYCKVPEAAEHFKKLLDGATQVAMDFHGGRLEDQSVIGFRLRNANGEMYLALRKEDWGVLEGEPDSIFFIYGEGDKGMLQTTFLNRAFEDYLEEQIEQYNQGKKDTFILDVIASFAEEDEI